MKVCLEQVTNDLLIIPETEFEIQWLCRFGQENGLKAFHRTGLTPADYLGIKVTPKKER